MNVLEVVELRKHFPIRRGFLRRIVGQVRAVDGVSFHIRKGETLALVGESGCGKTTVSRCVLRALVPTSGAIRFTVDGKAVDLAVLSKDYMTAPVEQIGGIESLLTMVGGRVFRG